MARKIMLTKEDIDKKLFEVEEKLSSLAAFRGEKIEVSMEVKEKATLYFRRDAYYKMTSLVKGFDTEVMWEGQAERIDDTTYLVTDIIVPPQYVSGAYWTQDEDEDEEWRTQLALSDFEFEKLKFHGHSHVNMGVSPSGTDMHFRAETLKTLLKDDFYIFLIWNKRDDFSCEIYDFKNNIVFNEKDVSIKIDYPEVKDFLTDAKKKCKPYSELKEREYKKTICKMTKKEKEIKEISDEIERGKKELEAICRRHGIGDYFIDDEYMDYYYTGFCD